MKKGISLIVLVITIIVLALLVTFVIVTIKSNNPVSNAKIASVATNKENIESSVLNYVGKVKVDTVGRFKTEEIITGNNAKANEYRITEKVGTQSVTCTITKEDTLLTLYKLDRELYEINIADFPEAPNANSEWYLDELGKVYLVFEKDGIAPKWMTSPSGKMDDPVLLTFVVYKDGLLGKGVSSK